MFNIKSMSFGKKLFLFWLCACVLIFVWELNNIKNELNSVKKEISEIKKISPQRSTNGNAYAGFEMP